MRLINGNTILCVRIYWSIWAVVPELRFPSTYVEFFCGFLKLSRNVENLPLIPTRNNDSNVCCFSKATFILISKIPIFTYFVAINHHHLSHLSRYDEYWTELNSIPTTKSTSKPKMNRKIIVLEIVSNIQSTLKVSFSELV